MFRHSTQVDASRQIVLADFYKVLDAELKAGGEKDLTKEETDALFMRCIEKYRGFVKGQTGEWDRIWSTLESMKDDLAAEKKINKAVTRNAHKNAGMLIGGAFSAATMQLVGFSTAIYGIWDWNTVEPWTWTFCKYF